MPKWTWQDTEKSLNLGALTLATVEQLLMLSVNSLVCKKAPSRIARHQHLNDMVTHVFVSTDIPATKEPVDLIPRDGNAWTE